MGLLCVPNAIAHAIMQLRDDRVALRSLTAFDKHNRQFRSFKPIGDVIRGLDYKLNVRKPEKYGVLKRKAEDKNLREGLIAEVCSWTKGVWLVRL